MSIEHQDISPYASLLSDDSILYLYYDSQDGSLRHPNNTRTLNEFIAHQEEARKYPAAARFNGVGAPVHPPGGEEAIEHLDVHDGAGGTSPHDGSREEKEKEVDPRGVPVRPVTGVSGISRELLQVHKWMARGKCIEPPRLYCESRKRGRGAFPSAGGRQKTQIASTASNKALTKIPLSRVNMSLCVIVYGRPNFLIEDECYFRDDDEKIAIIDRFLVQPVDPLFQAYIRDKEDFFGTPSRGISIASLYAEPHFLLDFSFCLNSLENMFGATPACGTRHFDVPLRRPLPRGAKSAGSRLQFADAPRKDTKKFIKASTKEGERAGYEFREIKAITRESDKEQEREMEIVEQQLAVKYEADAVRLCYNELSSVKDLCSILNTVISNAFLSVRWLDLSCNKLCEIGDLSQLECLSCLYLHGNKISSWDIVDTQLSLLNLTSLTLHGNPIAMGDPEYRQRLLLRLLRPRKRFQKVNLQQLDFVLITPCDVNVTHMYDLFTFSDTKPLLTQRGNENFT